MVEELAEVSSDVPAFAAGLGVFEVAYQDALDLVGLHGLWHNVKEGVMFCSRDKSIVPEELWVKGLTTHHGHTGLRLQVEVVHKLRVEHVRSLGLRKIKHNCLVVFDVLLQNLIASSGILLDVLVIFYKLLGQEVAVELASKRTLLAYRVNLGAERVLMLMSGLPSRRAGLGGLFDNPL